MPPTDRFARLYTLLGPKLRDINGSTVVGEVPFADSLINKVIADALVGREAPVTAVHVEPRNQGRLLAHVSLRGPRFVPPVTVNIQIEDQPKFPESPILTLRWSLPKLGFLGNMAAPFLSQLKKLPAGVRLEGEQIFVDIAEMLRSHGWTDVLNYLHRLELDTSVGEVIVRFELRVRHHEERPRRDASTLADASPAAKTV
jgi:hypothetical protein